MRLVRLVLCGVIGAWAEQNWHTDSLLIGGSNCSLADWRQGAGTYQAVVWFHGGMNSSNPAKGLSAWIPLSQNWHPKSNTLLISCSAWGERNWLDPRTVQSVDRAIEHVRASKKLSRIRLIGISDGSLGVLAYQILGHHSAYSATLISSFPGLVLAPEQLGHAKLQSIKWTFVQGGQDRLYPISDWQKWMRAWTAALPQTVIKIDPMGEHDFSYWQAHHMDWILQSLEN